MGSMEWAKPPPTTASNLAETFGEILTHNKYTAEVLKEYVFEDVRSSEFAGRPSRRRCMFLFDAVLDPNLYATTLQLRAENLFEVEVLSGALHRARYTDLACNLSKVAEIEERARSYWKHRPEPALETEILFEGQCRMHWLRRGHSQ